MKLLRIATFYIGVNIIGLSKVLTYRIYENVNKIKTTLIIKSKIYN